MNTKITTTAAASILGLLLAGSAAAGSYQKQGGEMKAAQEMERAGESGVAEMSFDAIDTDRDGYLSQREVQQQAELSERRPDLIENWNKIDKDNDDRLDKSEFSAFEAMGPETPAKP
jgi:hypothetical protein